MKFNSINKEESIVSIAVAAILVLVAVGIKRQWNGSILTSFAASAEGFVLKTAGIRGRIPDLPGYERVKAYYLGEYRAGFYRATPAPLIFASYRFVIYNRSGQPVFKTDTVEASAAPWSRLYDFAGRHGIPDQRRRGGPRYTSDLTGDGIPDIILGQYSGGDRCCSTVTIIELGKTSAKVLGQISGLDGLPFEGLQLARLAHTRDWQLVVHRPYHTACSSQADSPEITSIYAYDDGQFSEQTTRYASFLNRMVKNDLARWRVEKLRSLHLLQSVAADFSQAGQPSSALQFIQENLPAFNGQIQSTGIDPMACSEDLANLIANLSSHSPQVSQISGSVLKTSARK